MLLDLLSLTRPQLHERLAAWGFAPAHAARLWKYLYREEVDDLAQCRELPARLRERLLAEAHLPPLSVVRATDSDDGLTRKFLLALADGPAIEAVAMRYPGRVTACLSSQAGCALGCVFCATGQMGFGRNLTTGEIVAQARFIARLARRSSAAEFPTAPQTLPAPHGEQRSGMPGGQAALRNVVLMGMGEPLLNYDAVIPALEILSDNAGLAIAAKRLTVSTVGVAPGIRRLAAEARPFSLAVSLHAATQEERAALAPAARTWPLSELLAACRDYSARLHRKIFFEWTLIAGVNDSPRHAAALADLLRGQNAHVNLIPLNDTAGYAGAPSRLAAARAFQTQLLAQGLPTTLRQKRGLDIAAGCGQLAAAPD